MCPASWPASTDPREREGQDCLSTQSWGKRPTPSVLRAPVWRVEDCQWPCSLWVTKSSCAENEASSGAGQRANSEDEHARSCPPCRVVTRDPMTFSLIPFVLKPGF